MIPSFVHSDEKHWLKHLWLIGGVVGVSATGWRRWFKPLGSVWYFSPVSDYYVKVVVADHEIQSQQAKNVSWAILASKGKPQKLLKLIKY